MFNELVLQPIINIIKGFPYKDAFCIDGYFFKYSNLGENISKIRKAFKLMDYGKNIGLVVNDDIETYASIIALWIEGKSYIPLHPTQPLDRCMEIVEQVSTMLILDSSEESRYSSKNVLLTKYLIFTEKYLEITDEFSDEDLAYILFTSGSTGKPKGVQITRGNIGAFMDSFWKTGIEIDKADKCLQCFDLTFDVSVQSFLAPLIKGACVFTVPVGQIKYQYVGELIENYKLTFCALAPSMLRYLKPYFEEIDATSIKQCILTAEACPLSLIDSWRQCASNAQMYDFYGPTEATIYCTYYKIHQSQENKMLNGIVSIGKPMSNIVAIIVDEQLNILIPGEKGELCIAGKQLTKGYWKNQERNQNSFFMKEIDGIMLRFYHTGDLCYQDEDGDIMYSGRLDFQAKIQGYRVELGEIEYVTNEYLKGINVVAIPFSNKNDNTEIGLVIESEPIDTKSLMAFLGTKLPTYMLPTKVLYLNTFPLNVNGKTDRNKLKNLL